jgi:hypothetical protein
MIKIALIGSLEDRQNQLSNFKQYLEEQKIKNCFTTQLDPEGLNARQLHEKVRAVKITHVVSIKVKNGSVGYWALELSKTCIDCPIFCGIEIPGHLQSDAHEGMKKVRMISSLSEIFRNENEREPAIAV